MQVEIYHKEGGGTRFPDDYTRVAVVEVDELWRAFLISQNSIPGQKSRWVDNPGVIEVDHGPARSTEVGDVVLAPSGEAYRCLPHGWGGVEWDHPLLDDPYAQKCVKPE